MELETRLSKPGCARLLRRVGERRCQDASRAEPPGFRLGYSVQLTRREREVARMIFDEQSNQESADEACLGFPTVKQYVQLIFRKLEVTSRTGSLP
jgi:DNA-binding CsgD family transcriptional regulator